MREVSDPLAADGEAIVQIESAGITITANPRMVRTMSEHVDMDMSGILRLEMTIDRADDALVDQICCTEKGRVTAATLTGANPSRDAGSFFSGEGNPPGTGQCLIALRPGEGFCERLEPLLSAIAETQGARLPGARRAKRIAEATTHGIAVPTIYMEEARTMAAGHD
nr:UxaA family hydrolase [Paracoccus salsus]